MKLYMHLDYGMNNQDMIGMTISRLIGQKYLEVHKVILKNVPQQLAIIWIWHMILDLLCIMDLKLLV